MQDLKQQAQEFTQQAEQTAKTTASTVGGVGVKKEAKHFSDKADAHRKKAVWWFRGVALGGVALLSIAGYFHFCGSLPETGNFDWSHFVPHFSILGLLIFFEVVLIGNYKAERHNAIVNKHRTNALTVTQDVKGAVTLIAVGAIYAPQETGFRGGGSAQMQNPAEILAAIIQNRTE